MIYQLKVQVLKTRWGSFLWRKWHLWRRHNIGSYHRLPEYIRNYVFPGASFVDIGCMWGVNGEYAFLAEEYGASVIKGVDVFGPTPEFEAKKRDRKSSVEFILGDGGNPDTIARVGVMDIVFCAGVLYHHPSPFDLLVALRRMCRKTLILRTSSIPEINGLPNAAVYYPMLNAKDRKLWNLSSLGLMRQVGITDSFEPEQGYGNWFWGMTPSCLTSLLKTAGFQIEHRFDEPFAQTFICKPVAVSFEHRLPNETEARDMATVISTTGFAQPA
jgi:SAM-dependent methyltransferase